MLLALLLGQGTAGPVTHDTSGTLAGPGSTVAGAATRFRAHDSSGVLPGQTATVAGAADRQSGAVTHATTGVLTGPGSTAVGASARTRAHPTSGVLAGQGSSIVGAAQHKVLHSTTGALSGPGSALVGAAARTRQHATDGTLTGQGSALTGLAARTRQHATTGVLTTDGAIIVGSAARTGAAIVHDTSGVLTGPGAIIVGDANLIDPPRGGGGPGNAISIQRRKPRGWANERAAFEQSLLEPDEQRQADLGRIAQTLADSGQAQAQRIARKLADYTGELTQAESLQRELAKLEAVQRSRELWAERNQDVQAAAAELSDILRDDEDVAGALVALHEHETRLMLGVLGITMK